MKHTDIRVHTHTCSFIEWINAQKTNLNNNEIYIKNHSTSPSAVSIFDLIIVILGSFSLLSFGCFFNVRRQHGICCCCRCSLLLWYCILFFLIFRSALESTHTSKPRNNNQHGGMTWSFSLIFAARHSADSIMVCFNHPN